MTPGFLFGYKEIYDLRFWIYDFGFTILDTEFTIVIHNLIKS
jgi:hypothetical protein